MGISDVRAKQNCLFISATKTKMIINLEEFNKTGTPKNSAVFVNTKAVLHKEPSPPHDKHEADRMQI